MGAMHLLNAMRGQGRENTKTRLQKEESCELMYLDIKLNGQTTRAMVDTGTTHNFITDREAKRLGLIFEKSPSRMKAVNSEAKGISGLVKVVPIKIGTWSGSTNMIAVPLDDF